MDINLELIQWFINFLIKKASGETVKKENNFNKELAEELLEIYIIRKVQSSFVDNIRVPDLADMHLIREFNKGVRFLLSGIDIYSKYALNFPLDDLLQLLMLFKRKNLKM